ncbi:hypothetical protein [Mesorhizobium sp. 8]|uniref:hypothetical protein n=1 Tax=Mesorhizobium sp. 8 TaxID=2584466 RepID=UPI00111F25F3|nr:hypothetical protein [Mesorhizobium sp. 8]QDC00363.1 hypothetical protein FGU64_08005 [Mesorhizobium sp. 8]
MSAVQKTQKDKARTNSSIRKAATLDYVREMLRELRDMTDAENEQFITHLIGMAYLATSDVIRTRYANLVSGNHSPKEVRDGSAFQGR